MGLLSYEQEMLFTKFQNENSGDFINKNKLYHKAGISVVSPRPNLPPIFKNANAAVPLKKQVLLKAA